MAETQRDAVRFLTEQHETIRRLLADVAATSGAARQEAFDPLVRLLAVHETAEEMVIYPAIRSSGHGEVANARTDEEDKAKKALTDLELMDVDSPEFEVLFAEVRVAVEAHADAEEATVFPLLLQTRDNATLRRMTAALQVAEAVAPTHPHRFAPESAIGNVVVGPFVAVVDRVRDMLHAATHRA